MKKIRVTKKSINQIHKFTGIAVCVFLIHLSITGIFLNHTEDLDLDEKYTASPMILALYNISIPNQKESFLVNDIFISRFGDQVFMGNQPIIKNENPITGATLSNQVLFIAFPNEMVLLTQEGELIERISSTAELPENIQKLGVSEGILYLKTPNQLWQSSDQAQAWELSDSNFNDWSNEVIMPDQQTKQIEMYFSGKGVSLEQFFLDLHNGNIIKGFGKWLLDIIAIFLLLLSISGIWIWLKKRRY
ncbi:PepSY domain-containing protein [Methylophilaceae bacterium]|nr:PepSY domain-containing protein [Methylophilaceae bacterium]